jgi:hypothetical protein
MGKQFPVAKTGMVNPKLSKIAPKNAKLFLSLIFFPYRRRKGPENQNEAAVIWPFWLALLKFFFS